MTTEREPLPYWNDERPLGRVHFGGNNWLVHARSYVADEAYSPASTSEERLFGLTPRGRRTYVQSRLYIHAPEDSFHEMPFAAGQAHFYPADRLVTIWELFVEPRHRQLDDPREDLLLRGLWTHYERFLVTRFPAAARIGALWEPDYDRARWAGFLAALGYQPHGPAVFIKTLPFPDIDPTRSGR
jgi:hypothetical protein